MADRDELLALAERVEKLKGPDRAVDAEINKAMGYPVSWGAMAHCDAEPYEYTDSIDAAMTLVPRGPKGWSPWAGWEGETGNAFLISNQDNEEPRFDIDAATPALALTAASLRAIASEMDHG